MVGSAALFFCFTSTLGRLLAAEGGAQLPELSLLPDSGGDSSPTTDSIKQPEADIFDYPVKPTDGVYAQVKNGKLYYGDQRLRLWGLNRNDSPNLDMVDRLWKVGFNAIRLWGPKGFWNDASIKTGIPSQSVMGDHSLMDQYDRFFAELKKRGFFIWVAGGLGGSYPMNDNLKALMQDDSFIAGGDDWPQWKAGINALLAKHKRPGAICGPLLYFDDRTQKVFKANATAFLNHVNPYTGKRYAEEEAVAVWEVQNENGFVVKALQNELDNWPDFFRAELRAKWNAWLKARYQDDAGLKQAWGALGNDESLDHGIVHLGPTLHERNNFPKARGDDYVHFIVDLVVTFNRDFHEFCRAQAPAGVGVNVEPFVFDTQYVSSIPWLAANALSGDTVSVSHYQWALTSTLSGPPSMYVAENHTVKGKAMLIYETNSGNTNPFRGEFPLRMAALAGRQDWDGVFFHFYHAANEHNADPTPEEMYLAGSLQYITKGDYWTGTHFAFDPIMGSTIAIAGRIFLEGAIPPAKSPAVYRLADDAIFSYEHFNGIDQRDDTFTRGSLIDFTGEPTGGVQVDRPAGGGDDSDRTVTYDPDRQRMIIDTPLAHAYVGQTGGRYQFHDGILVGDFNQPFISFAMVSADGQPLAGSDPSKKIFIAAVNNAHNTGFDMDMSIARASGGFVPPLEQVPAIRSYGTAPILVDPVQYNLWFPTNLTYLLGGYDFALRQVLEQNGTDKNELSWDGSKVLFMNVLNVTSHGGMAAVPKPEEPALPVETATASGAQASGTGSASALADVWNPLPGVKWSDDYATTHQILRDGNFVKTSISEMEQSPNPNSSIVVYEAEVILNAPANIEIDFQNAQMNKIVVAFTQPPVLSEAVAAYEKQFGVPVKKTIAPNASETSLVTWQVQQKAANLEITLTETQGTMEITYIVTPK
ncbi:MAG: beta-galactosidase [Methylacidiphilales bacterium]|nr:beta-galactosidase [Candidatus Methylacidiphilales bacterium]